MTEGYAAKPEAYFAGERRDFIDGLSPDVSRVILEIGCGDGATGAYARSTGRCGCYFGVEISPRAAALAAERLDEVIEGDVEAVALPIEPDTVDVLIASEVLEHLVDPWGLLVRLRLLMKPNGLVLASSPNVSHWSVAMMLSKGRWDLADEGRMDRTHLRWFTPASYRRLFEQAGFEVRALQPLIRPGRRAQIVDRLTGGRLAHLFISQMVVEARVSRELRPAHD